MAAEAPPPSSEQHKLPTPEEFTEVQESAEFGELRRSYRSFAFPLTVAFIAWYLLYVLLSNYAGGFMGTKLFGNINVALVFGVLQFISTFVLAYVYSRYSTKNLDPLAAQLQADYEKGRRGAGESA